MEELKCSNCNADTNADDALVIRTGDYVVAAICPDCQQATHIRIDLKRREAPKNQDWEFYQYFPVKV